MIYQSHFHAYFFFKNLHTSKSRLSSSIMQIEFFKLRQTKTDSSYLKHVQRNEESLNLNVRLIIKSIIKLIVVSEASE
jgi:hypothetical protein